MEDIVVPVFFFALVAAVALAPRYLKSVERLKLQEIVRAAIDNGQSIPQGVIEALAVDVKPAPSPERDLRTGVIWVGLALGMAAFGVVIGLQNPSALYPLVGAAAFPGFVGAAFIVVSRLARRP